MTVQLAPDTFLAPVEYRVIGDYGQPFVISFSARYRRLSRSERQAADKRMRKAGLQSLLAAALPVDVRGRYEQQLAELGDIEPLDDAGFAALVTVGWNLVDVRATPVPFDDPGLAVMFDQWEGLDTALARAYLAALYATPDAAEKNSVAPSVTATDSTAQTTE